MKLVQRKGQGAQALANVNQGLKEYMTDSSNSSGQQTVESIADRTTAAAMMSKSGSMLRLYCYGDEQQK